MKNSIGYFSIQILYFQTDFRYCIPVPNSWYIPDDEMEKKMLRLPGPFMNRAGERSNKA